MYFFYYIPVGLDVERRRQTFLTWFLAVFCTIIYLVTRYAPVGSWWNVYNLVFIPLDPSPATAVAHLFVHAGWFHLAGNMVYLLVFGRAVEDRLGAVPFVLVFALSAMAGAYTHVLFGHLFSPAMLEYGIVGASGATSGLLGAFLVRFWYGRIDVAWWVFMPLQGVNRAGRSGVPVFVAIVVWAGLQALQAVLQFGEGGLRVAYGVHVGGFAAGALLAVLFGAAREARVERILVKARRHVRRAEWFAARAEFADYLERRPGEPVIHLEAARASVCGGDAGAVRYHYVEAIRAALRRRERSEAEDAFIEGMRHIEGFSLAERLHLDLACGMERSLRFRGAMMAYANFVGRYPRSAETPFVLLRMAGLLERRDEDPAGALRCLRRIADRYPDDPWVDFAVKEARRIETTCVVLGPGPEAKHLETG
ncbi:MAG: rhomboid family intramembrane serine protease [Candidatus Krumholzibacteriota bacterium]|nr:rhomboid family intramembrane serine protease [Candidatus Krumholzibacteriota bacterium]